MRNRPFRPVRAILALVAATLFPATAGAVHAGDAGPKRTPASVDGSIAWIFSDSLDLVGTMSAEAPLPRISGVAPYAGVDTRTAIERAISGLTFRVQSLDYRLELGSRWDVASDDELSIFVQQRGRESVDRKGEPWARVLGARFRSRSRTLPGTNLDYEWSIGGGPVFQDREVDADFLLSGQASLGFPEVRSLGRLRVDLGIESIGMGSALRSDWSVGPKLVGREGTSLFVHYVREKTPFGIGTSGVEAGLDFAGTTQPRDDLPPRVGGSIASGIGDGRRAGRLDLRFATRPVVGPLWVAAEFDANVLAADDAGELYYLYHIGLARHLGRLDGGAYYYHRSNHTLAEPNDNVTSFDVLEVGAETPDFASPRGRTPARWGALEGRVRVGYVLDTSFDASRRWHLRGASRFWVPWPGERVSPFLQLEAETGDVDRREYAVGAAIGPHFEGRVEYRSDEAYLGRDQNALLVMTGLTF